MKFLLSLLLGISLTVPAFAEENNNTDTNTNEVATDSTVIDFTGDTNKDVDALVRTYFHNFGRVPVNGTRSASITIRNSRLVPLLINNIYIQGRGFFRFENCPQYLIFGQSCQVRVFFRPFRPGNFFGVLFINLTGQEDIRVNLFGRGVFRRF
ncbi:MAG: hypothetical protein ACXVCP_12005 [Bdellovibrio sp.]